MKFVALLSGGKDSVYAICEAERFGHEVVCCANVAPASEGEQDSMMYQSAGHRAVSGVAECLEVPLVRRATAGRAETTALQYAEVPGDEVEDLRALLRDVLLEFPEVRGVCSGAIWSTYQRTRVEHVCQDLGLQSLSYLWRRPQRALLEDICASVDAILVKTASAGLERRHLGRRLADLKGYFRELHDHFGFHECGEGGEYETLVLDCVRFPRKRLVLDHVEKHFDHPDDPSSPGVLDVLAFHTEPKDAPVRRLLLQNHDATDDDATAAASVTSDDFLDDDDLNDDDLNDAQPEDAMTLPRWPFEMTGCGVKVSLWSSGAGRVRSTALSRAAGDDAEAALTAALAAIAEDDLGECFFAHLYVTDMRDFAAANRAYAKFFASQTYQPPSRVCVGLPPTEEKRVAVDLDFVSHKKKRSVLHVKSLSRWAPVCIGPYCQANVLCDALVFVAGQIALDPPTMSLADDRLDLCFDHADAILRACDSRLDHVLSVVVYVVDVRGLDDSDWLRRHRRKGNTVLQVPALPKDAKNEVEVVAATDKAASLLEERHLVYRSERRRRRHRTHGDIVVDASVIVGGLCVASLTVGGGGDPVDVVHACVLLLRDAARLRFEHWTRLRVFVAPDTDAERLQVALLRALASVPLDAETQSLARPPGPALSVVHVSGFPEHAPDDVMALATLFACNLDAVDADLWLPS